ncbi:cytochrome P450 [Amylocystis lapponica]|nr:cytochrome P450 [Amylocystis lapponica]
MSSFSAPMDAPVHPATATPQLAVVLAIGLLLLFLADSFLRRRSKTPLPPGPPGLPLLGNVFDIPSDREWIKYKEWSDQYKSDVISLRAFGTRLVILNSVESTQELFFKRGSIYSSRPRIPMEELTGHMDWDFGLFPEGQSWKDHRRVFRQEFETKNTFHRPHELAAARRLLNNLLESGSRYYAEHLRHAAGDTILSTGYGIRIEPQNDPFVATAERVGYSLAKASEPGAFLVNSFPSLLHVPSWFPGAGFKLQAEEWRKDAVELVEAPFKVLKKRMADGTAISSVGSRGLQALEEKKDSATFTHDVRMLQNVLAIIYVGGTDTTISAMLSFMLAMVQQPAIQRKAQAALDAVTERKRLPDFSDVAALPYIDAIVSETLRWNPVVPLGVPHYTTADDVYRGLLIPKGTIVMGNSWALLHSAEAYGPDTDVFRPERFLRADGTRDPAVPEPEAAFGYGRRICPGRVMARENIWMMVASILAAFDISKPIGADGVEIASSGEYSSSLVCNPLPFKCKITPRFPDTPELILNSLEP